MTFDQVVLLLCAALWLLHLLQLRRWPWPRAWPPLLIALMAVSLSAAAYLFYESAAVTVAMSLVALTLLAPALALRGASRQLRWGKIGSARALATIAMVLRPIPAQRRFRRSVDVSWRLAHGQEIDLDQALDSLGRMGASERDAHRLAFLSWTNDFDAMRRLIDLPSVRRLAMNAGMAAIVTTVVGETGSEEELLEHQLRLAKLPAMAGRQVDASWALVTLAAYLGAAEQVDAEVAELRHDVPPDRVAFVRATALQRAGRPQDAADVVARALAAATLTPSSQQRLEHRLHSPLSPFGASSARERAIEEVTARIHARRALAAMGLGFRKRAPLTWAISAILVLVFLWQGSMHQGEVFSAWGLIAPFAAAPDFYRLISYAFLHLDTTHLSVNVVGLLVFGRFVEHHFGRLGHGLVYLLGAVVGGAAYLAFSLQPGVAIGASGAVMALFGATLAKVGIDPRLRRSAQGRRELAFLGAVAILQVVVDAFWAQSAGSAHLGGLGAGVLAGALLVRRGKADGR